MHFQIQSRLLDGAILSFIDEESLYGYAIAKRVRSIFAVSDSSIYPVLRRLKKQQLVTTYDHSYHGRNRRYYKITAAGSTELHTIAKEWWNFSNKINELMGEENG